MKRSAPAAAIASHDAPTLRSLGENELVRRIARWSGSGASALAVASAARAVPRGSAVDPSSAASTRRPPWAECEVVVAIGDDTALVRIGGAQQTGSRKSADAKLSSDHQTGRPHRGGNREASSRADATLAPLLALTTDLLVEGVHFLPNHPPRLLGAKALEVNLSDLAAVGAWPAWYLVSFGAPPDTRESWVRALYAGMRSVAARYGCACIGGDCVRADRLTINIVAGGLCQPGVAPPLRSRATPGQSLYVTGTLGDSGAGLIQLQAQRSTSSDRRSQGLSPFAFRLSPFLLSRHQHPSARVEAGTTIARLCPDAAMMDLSDGLATDLPRLAEASHCGFDVQLDALPLSSALRRFAASALLPGGGEDVDAREKKEEAGIDGRKGRHSGTAMRAGRSRSGEATGCDAAQALALNGGEDYELLFTTARPESEWLDAVSRAADGRRLRVTRIGEVTACADDGVRYLDKSGRAVEPPGHPFAHY